jgi:hypothetical protein
VKILTGEKCDLVGTSGQEVCLPEGPRSHEWLTEEVER